MVESIKSIMEQAIRNKKFIVDPRKYDALCTCGIRHPILKVRIYSDEDAYSVLAEDCKKFVDDSFVLFLDDENTHLAAGKKLSRCLNKKSVKYNVLKLSGDSRVTDILAKKIYDESSGHDLILSVGSGTINDLAKYVFRQSGILEEAAEETIKRLF